MIFQYWGRGKENSECGRHGRSCIFLACIDSVPIPQHRDHTTGGHIFIHLHVVIVAAADIALVVIAGIKFVEISIDISVLIGLSP